MKKHFLPLISFCALILSAQITIANVPTGVAAIPDGYYSSVETKSTPNTILDALYAKIQGHTVIGYDNLENYYEQIDFTGDTVWDMYSTCRFTMDDANKNQSAVCDAWNKEHSIPQSWFGKAAPMKSDLHHVYPTDARVNNFRSNYPYGEVAGSNGAGFKDNKGGHGLGKLGSCTFSGYSGTVFEPADQYKGDFARTFFYMVARYRETDFTQADNGDIVFTTNKTNLTDFAVALFMKWHRQDKVSQKEIDRNQAVYGVQNNRNPFIDYPYLAEYIWGEHAGEAVDLSKLMPSCDPEFVPGVSDGQRNTTDPAITSPKGNIAFGSTNTTTSLTKDITVKVINLQDETCSISLAISDDPNHYFSLSATSVSKAQALAGYNITITYAPEVEGDHSATLTISGCSVTEQSLALTGKCTAVHTITWVDDKNTRNTMAATGETLPIPSAPDDCSTTRVFMGWTASTSVTSAPADLFTTSTATVSAPATYNAVYADKTVEGSGPETPTKTTSIAVGDKVIFVCEDAKAAMTSISTTSTKYGVGTEYTSAPAATFQFEVVTGSTSGTYAFKNGDNYLYWTSGNSLNVNSTLSKNTSWTVSIDASGNATIKNAQDNTRRLLWNKQSPRFACYAESPGTNYYNVQLYKMTGGTTTTYSNYSLKCNNEATGIESIIESQPAASKILIDGHIYILREDKIYTIQGALVR